MRIREDLQHVYFANIELLQNLFLHSHLCNCEIKKREKEIFLAN